MSAVSDRDGGRCVCCDADLTGQRASEHHRILGNRSDNRPSNKILLKGDGTTGCHAFWHHWAKRARNQMGYIVSRHSPREATLTEPVYYSQPSLGRVGWYLLDDEGGLRPAEET